MPSSTAEGRASCVACGAPLPPVASFCPACGVPARRRRSQLAAAQEARGATRAIALLYAGALLSLIGLASVRASEAVVGGLWIGAEIALGVGALALLGRGSLAKSLAGAASLRQNGLGAVIGMATFAISYGFVAGLGAWLGHEPRTEVPTILDWLLVAAAAPLFEEWLCRGVLWQALLPFSTARARIPAAAALFGLLHCLGGLLGFPHRFVSGLAYGWLRERSGSLLPPLVAHATHNLLVLLMAIF